MNTKKPLPIKALITESIRFIKNMTNTIKNDMPKFLNKNFNAKNIAVIGFLES